MEDYLQRKLKLSEAKLNTAKAMLKAITNPQKCGLIINPDKTVNNVSLDLVRELIKNNNLPKVRIDTRSSDGGRFVFVHAPLIW